MSPPLAPRRWRPLIALTLVLDVLLVIANGLWYADYLRREGPPFPPNVVALISAQVAAIGLGLIVATPAFALIWRLGRHTAVTLGAGVLAVALGVLGFLVAAHVNNALILSGLVAPIGAGGFESFALVVAPVVEETTKLLVLVAMAVLLRPQFGVREGIVLGLLVGIGANLAETGGALQTQAGAGAGTPYGTIIAVRFGLFGLGLHAVTAALIGAGLGYAASRDRDRPGMVVLALALIAAGTTHAVWNAVASRLTLEIVRALVPEPVLGSPEPFPLSLLLLASSITTALLLAPVGLALAIAWRRAGPGPGPSGTDGPWTPSSDPALRREYESFREETGISLEDVLFEVAPQALIAIGATVAGVYSRVR